MSGRLDRPKIHPSEAKAQNHFDGILRGLKPTPPFGNLDLQQEIHSASLGLVFLVGCYSLTPDP